MVNRGPSRTLTHTTTGVLSLWVSLGGGQSASLELIKHGPSPHNQLWTNLLFSHTSFKKEDNETVTLLRILNTLRKVRGSITIVPP